MDGEKIDAQFALEWEDRKRARMHSPAGLDFDAVENPGELLVGSAKQLTDAQYAEALSKRHASEFAFTLARLAALFPNAHFAAALEDLGRLDLARFDFQAKISKLEHLRRDIRLAEEVHGVQSAMGCTAEKAIRVVALDVDAASAEAARQRVWRAWSDHKSDVVAAARQSARTKRAITKHLLRRDGMPVPKPQS